MNALFKEYKDLSLNALQEKFYEACKSGELDKVRYLLTSPELPYNANIFRHEGDALICAVNNLHYHIIDYLLNSPELKENLSIHTQHDFAIIQACENGDTEMVRYLLTSPTLKEHSDIHAKGNVSYYAKDRPFMMAYICERMEVLEYLILDYKIPKTESITKIINFDNKSIKQNIEHMFKIRDEIIGLHKEIKEELNKEVSKVEVMHKRIKI
jgi:hypothetical protein